MGTRQIVISDAAKADLDDIWSYIARDSDRMADRWIDRLVSEARRLADMPLIGHLHEGINPSFRIWPVGRYLIVYRPTSSPVEVVRIITGDRNVADLLRGD